MVTNKIDNYITEAIPWIKPLKINKIVLHLS